MKNPKIPFVLVSFLFLMLLASATPAFAANVAIGASQFTPNYTLADGTAGNWSQGGTNLNLSVFVDFPTDSNPGMNVTALIYTGQTVSIRNLSSIGTSYAGDGVYWNSTSTGTTDYNASFGNITILVTNADGRTNTSYNITNYKVDAVIPVIHDSSPATITQYSGSVGAQSICTNVTENTAINDATVFFNLTTVPTDSLKGNLLASLDGEQANSTERRYCASFSADKIGTYIFHWSAADNTTNRVEGASITLEFLQSSGGSSGSGGGPSSTPAAEPSIVSTREDIPSVGDREATIIQRRESKGMFESIGDFITRAFGGTNPLSVSGSNYNGPSGGASVSILDSIAEFFTFNWLR